MDWQYAFNGLLGIGCITLGWLLKTLWGAVESLRRDVRTLEGAAHEKFVRRDDWQLAVERLEMSNRGMQEKLDKMFELLSEKADR